MFRNRVVIWCGSTILWEKHRRRTCNSIGN